MDEHIKKLLVQLDDNMPGVRTNAAEALYEHNKKTGGSIRDLVREFESAIPKAEAEELRKKLADYVKANEAAAKANAALKRDLKAALWVKANWKMLGAAAAAMLVVVTGWWAYDRYWSRSEAVNAGLNSAIASATWREGFSEPVARVIGGEPYWLMFRGKIDASHYSDSYGQPVEMRCVHLYAAPAQPDSGQYRKPSPRLLGLVRWPELAMQCKPSPNQRADR